MFYGIGQYPFNWANRGRARKLVGFFKIITCVLERLYRVTTILVYQWRSHDDFLRKNSIICKKGLNYPLEMEKSKIVCVVRDGVDRFGDVWLNNYIYKKHDGYFMASCLYFTLITQCQHLFSGWQSRNNTTLHDNVIKWKHFPRYWPLGRGIHRSPMNSPHKGQWRGALLFSLICARINGCVNNDEAGDLRRHRVHYDVILMRRYYKGTNMYVLWGYIAWIPLQNMDHTMSA